MPVSFVTRHLRLSWRDNVAQGWIPRGRYVPASEAGQVRQPACVPTGADSSATLEAPAAPPPTISRRRSRSPAAAPPAVLAKSRLKPDVVERIGPGWLGRSRMNHSAL